MAPLVYVIILNYCSLEDTLECVNAINQLTYTNYRLLVIDNNSPDKSGNSLKQIIPKEQYLGLSKNYGYAGANNYGIEIALKNKADFIFIVNPDVRLPEFSLHEYINVMTKYPDIGALNPVQISSIGGPVDKRFKDSVLSDMHEAEIIDNIGTGMVLAVNTLFGASILLSRSAIEKVGGFDPLYFAYGEEEDLCRRLKFYRYKLAVTFNCPVVHLRSYQDKSLDNYRQFLRLKGRYLFILKDITASFREKMKTFYYNLYRDYHPNTKCEYIKASNIVYLKMLLWITLNMVKIIYHSKLEKRGFCHLKIK